MGYLGALANKYLSWVSLPYFRVTDILEIIILAFVLYKFFAWIKNTKAWILMRGLLIVFGFILIAAILQLDTILWIANRLASIIAIAAVIIFQPEIRRALEQLGERNFLPNIFSDSGSDSEEYMSDRTISEIVRACADMSGTKTGALIVIEQRNHLSEYERTGISLDSIVSRQLILNIFEHNTPLHDGAVIMRNNRIAAATCYLPLSDSTSISKDLGTRHRAAVGISEVTDAFVIVVSEETGNISYVHKGNLVNNVKIETLTAKLTEIQEKPEARRGFLSKLLLGKEKPDGISESISEDHEETVSEETE